MRNYKTEGIIIKRRNIGETDRIITVFTGHFGKIQVKAVGVRKIISRRAAHVELLNFSTLTLYKGRGLPILIEAATLKSFYQIKDDLTKVGFAYHICELVDGLCPENQENRVTFRLLKDTLTKLSGNVDIALVVHEFEIGLLTALGFWPRTKLSTQMKTDYFIENILERKLKSKQIIPRLG